MHKDIINLAGECREYTTYGKNPKYIIPKNSWKPLLLLSQPGQEFQLDYVVHLKIAKERKIQLLVAITRYFEYPSLKFQN